MGGVPQHWLQIHSKKHRTGVMPLTLCEPNQRMPIFFRRIIALDHLDATTDMTEQAEEEILYPAVSDEVLEAQQEPNTWISFSSWNIAGQFICCGGPG